MTAAQIVVPALGPALPEILLSLGAMVLILTGAIRGDRSVEGVNAGALVLLLLTLLVVVLQTGGTVTTLSGSFISDNFSRVMKALVLIGSAATILLSRSYLHRAGIDRFEYPILIVLCTIGMMVMASANDLIALYLGLELQSLAAYVIAAFHRDDVKSTEAGLKYFVLGALSSGMLLYGASLVYGFTGTVSFPGIVTALQGSEAGLGIVLGIVFVAAGVAFKLAAVPFHMWTPDVYEGSPTPVTAFFASAPKIAAMAMAVRVFAGAFHDVTDIWRQIIVFVAIASMALGSFAAIGQRNLKRLMAYSAIGNVGYALIGLAAGTEEGVRGVVIYMIVYLATVLGTFAVLLSLRREDGPHESVEDLSGLSRTHPVTAFCLAAMMFSLAGIPPLAGFFAKFYVFAAAIKEGLVALAVIGVVTSVVGAFYYLRLVKVMYFDAPAAPYEPMAAGPRLVLGLSSVVVILFVLAPAPLVNAAAAAARSLF